VQQNRTPLTSSEQDPVICPVCGEQTELVLNHLHWCRHCECGWSSPREFARRRGLRPHHVRQNIVERLPWHSRGKPIVKEGGAR
jgi:hypothetical protein